MRFFTNITWVGFILLLSGSLWGCRAQPPRSFMLPPEPASQPVLPPVTFPDYVHRIMFSKQGDLHVLHTNGSGQQNLMPHSAGFETMPEWSPDGAFIAFVSYREGNADIFIAPATSPGDTAQQVNLTQHPAQDIMPAWSADGRRLAFASSRYDGWGIYVMELITTDPLLNDPVLLGPMRRSYNQKFQGHPAWSPDGQQLAYTTDAGYRWQINVMGRDGGNQHPFPGTERVASAAYPTWSPDGTYFAFAGYQGKNWDIYTITSSGEDLKKLTSHPAPDWGPRWSPDGQWIAFVSQRGDNSDLYIISTDGSQEIRLTDSPDSDIYPIWEPVPILSRSTE